MNMEISDINDNGRVLSVYGKEHHTRCHQLGDGAL